MLLAVLILNIDNVILVLNYKIEIKMKISIITICFNVATDLENTIASVRSQKYKDYEYIVVDGGIKILMLSPSGSVSQTRVFMML